MCIRDRLYILILNKVLFYVLSISYLLLTGCAASKQKAADAELTAIRQVLHEQQEAWNTGNIHKFMEGYWNSPELSFIGSRGVTKGWEQTLNNYLKSYPDTQTMGKLDFEVLELKLLSGNAAYMIGKYTLTREKDKPSGHFNLLWEKRQGRWYITSDHTSG